ncbi:MAG: hypothetical protein LBT49_04205, partial [Prevotellaceae bacterium]|nr:hypothetical protein [Prevotellaceae bacterium]
ETPLQYTLRDSLLLIEPFVYSKEHKWDGEIVSIKIYVPQDKKLQIEIPHDRKDRYHRYHNRKHRHHRIRIGLNVD